MPIVRKSLDQVALEGGGHVDLERVDALADEDIARSITEDFDVAPEITEDDLDRAEIVHPDGSRTPYREVVPRKETV